MPGFEPFFDWPDLTACVPAGMTAAELNAQGAGQQAHWPLWLDGQQSLGDLFLSARFCSQSFRYGSLADNVLGLRWVLPNGHKVDLGGRVVKNVAGFDFVRFLCGSQGQFGRPESLILRLRPLAPVQKVAVFQGSLVTLTLLLDKLRRSSWAHALDAVDLHNGKVHVAYSNEAALIPLFENAAQAWAKNASADLSWSGQLPQHSIKPWAKAQMPLTWMLEIAQTFPGSSGFLGQGLLHLEKGASLVALQDRLGPLGGHVEHPSIQGPSGAVTANWEELFLQKMEAL